MLGEVWDMPIDKIHELLHQKKKSEEHTRENI
jgi:hypothetical protein